MVKKDELGLISKRKVTPTPAPPKPELTFDGGKTSEQLKEPEIDFSKLNKERGTLRPSLDQKAKFDALLYVSPYEFVHELLGDFIEDAVTKLSDSDKEEYEKELKKQRLKAMKKVLK